MLHTTIKHKNMEIYQTNSLSLYSETFTQPCAEQRKSLVEQTEEITVE